MRRLPSSLFVPMVCRLLVSTVLSPLTCWREELWRLDRNRQGRQMRQAQVTPSRVYPALRRTFRSMNHQESHLLDNPKLSLGRKLGADQIVDTCRKDEGCIGRLLLSLGVSGGWYLCRAIHGAQKQYGSFGTGVQGFGKHYGETPTTT